jgi:hypothetical protein
LKGEKFPFEKGEMRGLQFPREEKSPFEKGGFRGISN